MKPILRNKGEKCPKGANIYSCNRNPPFRFEIMEPARSSVLAWLERSVLAGILL